jgi:hypothetical protein
MNRAGLALAAVSVAALLAWPVAGRAEGITSYRCSDGSHFIVGFFPQDPRAFLQIDGGQVTLTRRRFGWSGTRYSGHGVTLMISKAGQVVIRHARLPASSCEPLENKEGPER